ncbi:3-oxoacyl-[acyl-carrier-protein] reductase [Zhaonella formicivorans]|uniref:3-oxoacyl-[acyl-carrier-protein] reductase n=1 Tax=Zhaonella formicivorans TaxID=2528593 RepID=UPI0010D56FDA
MQKPLQDQVAIVTGGSRGIGKAICLALAQAGVKVVLNYNGSSRAAEEVMKSIAGFGGAALSVQGNVAKPETAERLVKAALEHFGRLDILVNNAGITRDNLLVRMKEEDWDAVFDVNLKGMFHCTKAALKPMMKQRSGRIINIASIIGLTGNAGQANYAAAKAAILGFTKSVAKEVGQRQILVNAIAPGFIVTDMTEDLPDALKTEMLQKIPLGRFGHPEDIAQVVVFLASPAASFITGQTIIVDGGMVIQ